MPHDQDVPTVPALPEPAAMSPQGDAPSSATEAPPSRKPLGKHPENALTAVAVRNVKQPGRYADGGGLYLIVEPSGAKRWVLRIVVQGRRRDIGLGGVGTVSLAEARAKAAEFRKLTKAGGDPVAERRKLQIMPTFEHVARKVHAAKLDTWKNGKHRDQWINTLATYAFPIMGGTPVDRITRAEVLRVLDPIWTAKPETARRVRQRLAEVFDWAKARGWRSGDNPCEGVESGLAKQRDRAEGHAALPIDDTPEFIARLRATQLDAVTKLAFEFLILTAARSGEVRGARWAEIDWRTKTWTVPAERMKSGRTHAVPLSERSLAILQEARALGGADLVFPGRSDAGMLSENAFLNAAKSVGMGHVTGHGFRSTFKDWTAERTHFPNEVSEMALAHVVGNKVEAAYRRGDLLEKRRALMEQWATFATTLRPEGGGTF